MKAYIDDILVVKKGSFEEHLEQLDEVFHRCKKTGLKMNTEKCRFGLNEINYLGYIVTLTGVKPNPKKIEAIKNIQRPTTVTEVRRLMGMVQYYVATFGLNVHTYSNLSRPYPLERRVQKSNGLQNWRPLSMQP